MSKIEFNRMVVNLEQYMNNVKSFIKEVMINQRDLSQLIFFKLKRETKKILVQ